ncbi:hypothetical protein J3E64_002899 [Sphingobium sp. OAS761]|nr:hypothetical protein [Sphingobium sp. OAS761]
MRSRPAKRLEIPHPRHDGGALRVGHAAPMHDFLYGPAAAGAVPARRVERAEVAARRFHHMKL